MPTESSLRLAPLPARKRRSRSDIRQRALRAAKVVTLALGLATVGCSGRAEQSGFDGGPNGNDAAVVADAGGGDAAAGDAGAGDAGALDAGALDAGAGDAGSSVDGGSDGGQLDAGQDAGSLADAGLTQCTTFPPDTEECCANAGGFWSPTNGCAIAIPGPFVPPAMLPPAMV